jgi:hypothetical protein
MASLSRRQRVRLIEHRLRPPSNDGQPVGGVNGKPAIDRVAEQPSVFEEIKQRFRCAVATNC